MSGKRALAVGCGQGFGAVTARTLASEGASVVVADIESDKAEQVAADIGSAGGSAMAHWVDVGSEDAVRELVKAAADRLGGLDVVFNNAAALGTPLVGLYGPKDPATYGPYWANARVVRKGVACSPCTLRRCARPECMTLITADEVRAAALALL